MLTYLNALRLNARLTDLLSLTAEWLSNRTQQHWTARRLLETQKAHAPNADLSFRAVRQGARSIWAMSMRTRAAHVAGRTWLLEMMLRDSDQGGALATFVIYVHDDINAGGRFPPPSLTSPDLVRCFLADANPVDDTPGLQQLPLLTREHAEALVGRAHDPARGHFLVIACPEIGSPDAERMHVFLAGRADVAVLRSPTPAPLTAVLEPGRCLAFPGRALILPPNTTRYQSATPARRMAVGGTASAINGALLKLMSPAILKAHLTVDDLKRRFGDGTLGVDAAQAML